MNAGLPRSSVAAFVAALKTGFFAGVQGVNQQTIAVGIAA